MAIAFILLALLVQAVGLVAARHRASAVAAAAALDASLPGVDPAGVAREAEERIEAILPGADQVTARVAATPTALAVHIRFRWVPPGPGWIPVRIGVTATAARVVPP